MARDLFHEAMRLIFASDFCRLLVETCLVDVLHTFHV